MKLLSKVLVATTLLLALNFSATAQRGGAPNSEQMAERETTRMVEKLNLDDAQTAKVQELNLKYANKVIDARQENKGNREAMQQLKTTIDTEKAADMKLVLNEEQFNTYTEMQNQPKKGGKGKRGGKPQKGK